MSGTGLALGAGLGAAFGVALDDAGTGLALGVAFGLLFGGSSDSKPARGDEPEDETTLHSGNVTPGERSA